MVKKSSKKRKYFNSTVATAVVASTVLGVTPVGAADLNYSDVKATDYFYDSIKSLADRGIVKGFPDGLYKPYESVTRGQAAVMLANLLQLDTENVKNPGFTDVPTTHPYYGAIAALSAKGIINGYEDKTYRP
ncbi:SLH-domain-containing protein, partial [Rhizophagus irregularis]